MKKLYDLDNLSTIIHSLKLEGKEIVLANGCFDLIHVGHVRYLQGAKQSGDILVVAVNSDASVKRLKGKDRPFMRVEDRIAILSALEPVDYITVFDEDSVDKVLLTLKPHIHAKGSDYTQESVPERDTVLSYGGKIAITGGPKVRSTSEIIRSISDGEKAR